MTSPYYPYSFLWYPHPCGKLFTWGCLWNSFREYPTCFIWIPCICIYPTHDPVSISWQCVVISYLIWVLAPTLHCDVTIFNYGTCTDGASDFPSCQVSHDSRLIAAMLFPFAVVAACRVGNHRAPYTVPYDPQYIHLPTALSGYHCAITEKLCNASAKFEWRSKKMGCPYFPRPKKCRVPAASVWLPAVHIFERAISRW